MAITDTNIGAVLVKILRDYAGLTSLVGTKTIRVEQFERQVPPYVVVDIGDGEPEWAFGRPVIWRADFEISCYDEETAGAEAVRVQVKNILQGYASTTVNSVLIHLIKIGSTPPDFKDFDKELFNCQVAGEVIYKEA